MIQGTTGTVFTYLRLFDVVKGYKEFNVSDQFTERQYQREGQPEAFLQNGKTAEAKSSSKERSFDRILYLKKNSSCSNFGIRPKAKQIDLVRYGTTYFTNQMLFLQCWRIWPILDHIQIRLGPTRIDRVRIKPNKLFRHLPAKLFIIHLNIFRIRIWIRKVWIRIQSSGSVKKSYGSRILVHTVMI